MICNVSCPFMTSTCILHRTCKFLYKQINDTNVYPNLSTFLLRSPKGPHFLWRAPKWGQWRPSTSPGEDCECLKRAFGWEQVKTFLMSHPSIPTVDGRNLATQLRLVVCPINYRVFTSQVVQDFSHQQYVNWWEFDSYPQQNQQK